MKKKVVKILSFLILLSMLFPGCLFASSPFANSVWEFPGNPVSRSRNIWDDGKNNVGVLPNRDLTRAKFVIIHHSATRFTATDDRSISNEIRRIQEQHINKGWGDIAYHYIIDPNGRVWEGRNSSKEGTHTFGYNHNIGILVLGDFERGFAQELNHSQYRALVNISKYGVWLDSLSLNAIRGHLHFGDTQCPGKNIHRELPSIERNVYLEMKYRNGILPMQIKAYSDAE